MPWGFMPVDAICGTNFFLIENGTIYQFGILESIVQMIWMRNLCGHLGSGIQYSNTMIYNNFPWPSAI